MAFKKLTEVEQEAAVRLYLGEKLTAEQIGRHLGVTAAGILKVLARRGVQRRKTGFVPYEEQARRILGQDAKLRQALRTLETAFAVKLRPKSS